MLKDCLNVSNEKYSFGMFLHDSDLASLPLPIYIKQAYSFIFFIFHNDFNSLYLFTYSFIYISIYLFILTRLPNVISYAHSKTEINQHIFSVLPDSSYTVTRIVQALIYSSASALNV